MGSFTDQNCLPQVQACRVRASLLDADGTPTGGASSSYVSDALVKATVKPVYESANEIKEKTACDAVAVDYLGEPSLIRADVDFDFVTPDPRLHSILISQGARLVGAWGEGWAFPPIGLVSGQISIELWAKRINNGVLDPTFPYAHWALPLVKSLQLGDRSFDNAAQHSLITGQAYENANWFDGPLNDWPAASDRIAQWIPVTTLPTADCTFDAVVAS